MPHSDNKPTPRLTAWTKKHDELCLKYKIPNSAQKLWHWLICFGQIGKRIEPSLKDFNAWIEPQRGKPFCQKQLKNAFNKLLECNLIKLVKQYNWHEFKLIIKPLSWLLPRKETAEKKSDLEKSSSNSQPETQSNQNSLADRDDQQQQSLNSLNEQVTNNTKPQTRVSLETKQSIKQLCLTADIKLPEECELYYFPIEKIKISLGFLKIRNKRDTIPNPIGWLIDCLRKEYYFEPENQRTLQALKIISPDSPYWEYYL